MFKLIFDYVKQHKWLYLVVVVTLIIYDITLLIPTQIIQRMVDILTKNGLTERILVQEMGLLLLVTFLNYGMGFIWHLKLFQASVNFKFDMQQRAFKKMVTMRTPFYEKFRSGDVMTRFSTDVDGLMEMVGYGLMIVVYSGGMLAFIIPTMLLIDWKISFLAILPMIFMAVAFFFIGRKQDLAIDANREAVAQLNNEVLEVVEGIRVTRAYSKKAAQKAQFQGRTKELADGGDRITSLQSLYNPLATVGLGLSTILVLVLGAGAVKSGQLSLGQVIALQLYVSSLLEPFWTLADFILVYQTGKTSFEKLQELIETGDDLEVDGSVEIAELDSISFKNYSFSYPQSDRPSLQEINWTLKAGQTVGIVGKTGSGKTSLVRQLLRQYPVGKGEFLVNYQSVLDFKRSSLEQKIGYVPQEHILFSKSVGENIAFGKRDSSLEEIEAAIATAAFSQDLERMSHGLDTMIGERGVSISGGQKQRISIARAFLREPDLLILDDSLSAVDARTEGQIIQNIQKERAGKTNVIVTHRLSAVNHADWVLVLDEGHIVEEGRPADLLAQEGWYYEQYQRQQSQEGGE
ncbi:ABC transporter ATP-binding protein [Streptococcus suis]|uniref:ABC transporter ATP-binding protein n=1 Tax=Streptococcus suis TaxID=1307 RepID=UPI0003FC0A05|nr:ABC transporter ATP-binding protein [Streptococcus suis]MBY4970547.1 ABC transporter ATP-binding protein/permease [Streptococcus suis]MBY4982163.1 ABC transporter ATP-binding protein/permease [Streptococcus suis]MBY4992907.1 ABC transporter ATP-binding protein/permease [Streptococcus suis]MBY5008314.1 ABC transporter ATP-binding protein/permease [Streptococcus suis]MDG4520413.1 ABC transporter ATP-binding protein/permease [Streptococcus suis]